MPSPDDRLPWPHLLAGRGTTVRAGGVGGILKTFDNILSTIWYLYLPGHSECLCSCNCNWDDDCQTDPSRHRYCSWNYGYCQGNNGREAIIIMSLLSKKLSILLRHHDMIMMWAWQCTCVSVCGAGRGYCSGTGAEASPHSWIQGQAPWRQKIIFRNYPIITLTFKKMGKHRIMIFHLSSPAEGKWLRVVRVSSSLLLLR